ncbi:hypothetical protein [Paraburkholderia phenazinium]|uniref:hypothetical protein n=1 Tax=Paraburkholderia phenazinium TaxID=60549 RepID=UPI00158B7CA1|nr:hypothetical protein [Paraburkholderia phenazinium]
MTQIDSNQLAAIPYIDSAGLDGRFLSSTLFYDDNRWRFWTAAEGRLFELKIVEPLEMFYFAREPQSEHDLYFHLLDFVAQRASIPGVKHAISGMMDDLLNFTTTVPKIELLHASRAEVGHGINRMVTTEIEYLFSVCRGLFDLLQEVISGLWNRVQLLEPSTVKKPLKKSFNEMVTYEGKPTTRESLQARFGLPEMLADMYIRTSGFFRELRQMRDNLVHRGSSVQTIFSDDEGFLISGHLRPFESMAIWRDEEKRPNGLVPLVPALSTMIYGTLSACGAFSHALEATIGFPTPLVPEMQLFLRCPLGQRFLASMRDSGARATPLTADGDGTTSPS